MSTKKVKYSECIYSAVIDISVLFLYSCRYESQYHWCAGRAVLQYSFCISAAQHDCKFTGKTVKKFFAYAANCSATCTGHSPGVPSNSLLVCLLQRCICLCRPPQQRLLPCLTEPRSASLTARLSFFPFSSHCLGHCNSASFCSSKGPTKTSLVHCQALACSQSTIELMHGAGQGVDLHN